MHAVKILFYQLHKIDKHFNPGNCLQLLGWVSWLQWWHSCYLLWQVKKCTEIVKCSLLHNNSSWSRKKFSWRFFFLAEWGGRFRLRWTSPFSHFPIPNSVVEAILTTITKPSPGFDSSSPLCPHSLCCCSGLWVYGPALVPGQHIHRTQGSFPTWLCSTATSQQAQQCLRCHNSIEFVMTWDLEAGGGSLCPVAPLCRTLCFMVACKGSLWLDSQSLVNSKTSELEKWPAYEELKFSPRYLLLVLKENVFYHPLECFTISKKKKWDLSREISP